jgi:hypothetical protein
MNWMFVSQSKCVLEPVALTINIHQMMIIYMRFIGKPVECLGQGRQDHGAEHEAVEDEDQGTMCAQEA